MPHRAPLVALALVCGFIAAVRPLLIGAAEIPAEQGHAISMKNPHPSIEPSRGAKDEMTREVDAGEVLNDRRSEIFDDPGTPVGGNPRGDVTIVEFFDYRCPYCKQVQPVLQALLGQDHKLRFIYKEMPVLGPASVVAARAALAAQRQGKYEAFHDAMMGTKGPITQDTVDRIAGSVGLDIDWLKQDMADPEIVRALRTNVALANALNIHGTPGFLIGNRIVAGAIDLDRLKTMIAAARNSQGSGVGEPERVFAAAYVSGAAPSRTRVRNSRESASSAVLARGAPRPQPWPRPWQGRGSLAPALQADMDRGHRQARKGGRACGRDSFRADARPSPLHSIGSSLAAYVHP